MLESFPKSSLRRGISANPGRRRIAPIGGSRAETRNACSAQEVSVLSSTLLAVFTFTLFSPLSLLGGPRRWYHFFAFTTLIFLTNRAKFSLPAARAFLLIAGLSAAGATLAVLRAQADSGYIKNTVGFMISLTSYALILPSMASKLSRQLVAIVLLVCAALWAARLNTFVAMVGDDARLALSGPGLDRNFIAFMLGLGISVLFCSGLFMPKGRRYSWLRFPTLAAALGLTTLLPSTFSRSGILVALTSIVATLVLYVRRHGIRSVTLPIGLSAILLFGSAAMLPKVLERFPSWAFHFERLVHWRTDDAMAGRRDLIRKGLLIVRENFVVGVGYGLSKGYVARDEYVGRGRGLAHNGFLTTWAELGLAGLIACAVVVRVWFLALMNRIRAPAVPVMDLVCLVAAGSMFAMNLFLDYPPVFWFFSTLVCSFAYQQSDRKPAKLGPQSAAPMHPAPRGSPSISGV